MTRINLVPPEILTDEHLLAEYKEITRPFNKVLKRIEKYGSLGPDVEIPKHYVLGKGHETFFFDKLGWLHNRYSELYYELLVRAFNVNREQFSDIYNSFYCDTLIESPYFGDYEPSPEEIYLNMSRLCKRSKIELVLNELKEVGL